MAEIKEPEQILEKVFDLLRELGIDGDMIQKGIHDTNEKLKERGCI